MPSVPRTPRRAPRLRAANTRDRPAPAADRALAPAGDSPLADGRRAAAPERCAPCARWRSLRPVFVHDRAASRRRRARSRRILPTRRRETAECMRRTGASAVRRPPAAHLCAVGRNGSSDDVAHDAQRAQYSLTGGCMSRRRPSSRARLSRAVSDPRPGRRRALAARAPVR